jgi:hypothetical protein
MAQGKPPLFSAIVDPHNIRLQHHLMLRWVLLCDYCICFYIFRRPLKFVGLSMIANYRHVLQASSPLFRVLFTIRIFLYHYQTTPEGAAVIYVNIQLQLPSYPFLSYMTQAWGMPASFVHSFIFPHLAKVLGPIGSPLPPMGLSCNSSQHSFLQWYSQ